jgi:hypothetical protein
MLCRFGVNMNPYLLLREGVIPYCSRKTFGLGVVMHTYNPSYLGGRYRRIMFWRPMGKSTRPYLKNKLKRTRGITQVIECLSEFNPQYCQKNSYNKTKQKYQNKTSPKNRQTKKTFAECLIISTEPSCKDITWVKHVINHTDSGKMWKRDRNRAQTERYRLKTKRWVRSK